MKFKVKETFLTLQGEGFHAGRAAVFCRFTGCNLWSGKPSRLGPGSCASWCDTDFVGTDGEGGGIFTEEELIERLDSLWPGDRAMGRLLVFTGGEPALQLTERLLRGAQQCFGTVAVETNGTLPLPRGSYWITVSPKAGTSLFLKNANELKIVYPQAGLDPEAFETFGATHRFLQPWDDGAGGNQQTVVDYILKHPHWRMSVQTHKVLNIR